MWRVVLLSAVLGLARQDQRDGRRVPLGLDERVPAPAHNPITTAKVELGRLLFFDRRLSKDTTVACVSCHLPELAFTDGKPVSVGVAARHGRRNAPTLVNRAYGVTFGWAGRAGSVEEQVLRAIQGRSEMDMSLPDLEERVRAIPTYPAQFMAVFGASPTAESIAQAIATFVRTIFSANSPFDRFDHGERAALSLEARAGLDVFRGKGQCIRCHLGPTFTDENFHNTGVAWHDGMLTDSGRYLVTGRPGDLGAFKTPTLREIERTAPYMHDGSIATLEDVIEFYDRGGNANPYLDEDIRPLNLTEEEKAALVVFLRSLSGTVQEGMEY